MSILKLSKGFGIVEIITTVVVIIVLCAIGWQVWRSQTSANQEDTGPAVSNIGWSFDGNKWNSDASPPTCPTPLLTAPAELTRVTSLLYPGQTRGDDYKPHGGLRFDGSSNADITVKLAMDAE